MTLPVLSRLIRTDNILHITSAEELNDDYVTIYSTCALVGALVMSFLAPADARPETSPDNIWGDTLSPFIVEADHVLVVIAFVLSFVMVFLSCVMLTQLAHIPKAETKLLFEKLGDSRVHAPLAHVQKLLTAYALHFVLATTLHYHLVTAIVTCIVTVLGIGFAICSAMGTIAIKTRTLEIIRNKSG